MGGGGESYWQHFCRSLSYSSVYSEIFWRPWNYSDIIGGLCDKAQGKTSVHHLSGSLGLKGSLGQSVEAVSQTKQTRMCLIFFLSKRGREK